MTDTGSAYRSHAFRDTLTAKAITHKRTRPYTPRTNGKAERFIQTSFREWAYATPFESSAERASHTYIVREATPEARATDVGISPACTLRTARMCNASNVV
jgi:transposase InsO family protein